MLLRRCGLEGRSRVEKNMDRTAPPIDLVRDILASARQTETECSDASSTAQTVVMNVRMVVGMMGEMLRGIGEIKERVSESQERAARARKETVAAVARVSALSKVVEQIATTADLINRIAQETNMLALNATIEAARAGESGKGFAVVAGEVKNLSKQTAQATEDVNRHLTSIRQANHDVVVSVEAADENLEGIQTSVSAVAVSVGGQASSTDTIASFAKDAADSVEAVASTLDRIGEIARLTSEKIRTLDMPETA